MLSGVRLAALALSLAAVARGEVSSAVVAVRVYQGQALVTRAVSFDAVAGPQQVVVDGLPGRIAPESLHAAGGAKVAIRAVRYRATAAAEAVDEATRALDRQLVVARDELGQLAAEAQTRAIQTQYVDRLETFVTATTQAELTRGVLDSRQLVSLTQFIFGQRAELSARGVAQAREQRRVSERVALLERQRKELAATGQPQRREAVLFLDAAAAGPAVVQLNYLVSGATWAPSYLARLGGQHDKLVIEYLGVVAQATGEDWPNVALTLSTSRPHMAAAAPVLAPLSMELVPMAERPSTPAAPPAGVTGGGLPGGTLQLPDGIESLVGYDTLAAMIVVDGAVALPDRDPFGDDLDVNVAGAGRQLAEIDRADRSDRPGADPKRGTTEGLAVDYAIAGRGSLRSGSDQQTFRIALLDLPVETYHTAAPLVSDYVYLAGRAINTSDLTLLAGPYSAYQGAAFTGRGRLPSVAKGEPLTIGFGTEPQLRAGRELLDKQTEVLGGNKVTTLTYGLRLQNFMGQPATVRLWDRIPQAPNDQVTVTITDNGRPLSTDGLYTEQERPRGLLRWDLDVPAGATGTGALAFTYRVKLEFDRQVSVGGLSEQARERMREDLAELRQMKR